MTEELAEIKDKLQNMELGELENDAEIFAPHKIHYLFSKLSDTFWTGNNQGMLGYIIKEFQIFFDGILELDDDMSIDEVYVLTCAGIYYINNRK